jgi:hypothetical protein
MSLLKSHTVIFCLHFNFTSRSKAPATEISPSEKFITSNEKFTSNRKPHGETPQESLQEENRQSPTTSSSPPPPPPPSSVGILFVSPYHLHLRIFIHWPFVDCFAFLISFTVAEQVVCRGIVSCSSNYLEYGHLSQGI